MKGDWLRTPKGDCSIVFVHGVLSSGESAWRNTNGAYWPQMLAETPSLSSVGIYVYEYRTNVFSGRYSLSDVVDDLKERLGLDNVALSSLIIFVCHSMGGIVVRKFLVDRATDLMDRKTDVGLFLVASPSLGSLYADWLNPLARFLNHSQGDALQFVKHNAWLADLDKEFQNLKESGKLHIKGKELVEDRFVVLQNVFRSQVVVESLSGARYFGEPYKVPASDHFSIAKPDGQEAMQHRLLVRFISEMLELSPQVGTNVISGTPHDIAFDTKAEQSSSPVRQGAEHRQEPNFGSRQEEYDRWAQDLKNGRMEVFLHPADNLKISILDQIVRSVLLEKQFSEMLVGNVHVVLLELLANLPVTSKIATRL
jgi:pimeloyl-ACP methyl ester carboxylesterase